VGGRNAALRVTVLPSTGGPPSSDAVRLREMFEAAGRNMNDYLTFKPLDPLYCLKFDDRDILVSADHAKMKAQIQEHFPGRKMDLEKFLRQERQRYGYLLPCIQKDYSPCGVLTSMTLIKALPYLSLASIFQNLGRYFGDEKLRLSSPSSPSTWECLPGNARRFSRCSLYRARVGNYPRGRRLNQISQAMAKVVEEEGGKIFTSTPVQSLVVEKGAVKGVALTKGRRFCG